MTYKKANGFTLIELLLVVGIIMGLAILEFQKMRADSDEAAAVQAGRDFGVVIDALQSYATKHMADYQDMNNAAAVPAIFPGVCAAVDADTCQLDLTMLPREGLVNSGWIPASTAIKTGYSAYMRRIPPAGGATSINDYNIEAVVRTDAGWTFGAGFVYGMLGSAAKQAGPSAGVVKGGVANGLFGAWSMPSTRYPGMSDGQLMGVVKVNASSLNQYVKLDGSRAMTGPLNMGNNRVNNINDIQMLGQSTLPRQSGGVLPMVSDLAPNWVLKGVYNVSDFGSDPSDPNAGVIPLPTCPDADTSSGVPRILVKMSSMYNEMYGGMSNGSPVVPGDSQAQMIAKLTSAYGGWNFYALEDTANQIWRVYVRRFYDNGYIPGEALAEVYCYYP
jgi:type II secretory pathway pseudopilin PulG